jgi:hypothetical protein
MNGYDTAAVVAVLRKMAGLSNDGTPELAGTK